MSSFTGNTGNDNQGDKPGGGENTNELDPDQHKDKRLRPDPAIEPGPVVVATDTSADMEESQSVIAIENALLAPIPVVMPATVEFSKEAAVDQDSQLTLDGSQGSQGSQELLDSQGMEGDDEASVASGLSTDSIDSITSLAKSVQTLESTGFTMAPTAEGLATEFGTFWSNNSHLGVPAVMVAFLSFAYSNSSIDTVAINGFFDNLQNSNNLRGPVIEAIKLSVPTNSAGGSWFSRISGGIRAVATTLAATLGAAVGANMMADEPLTIDNVTGLLFSVGEATINTGMNAYEFISQLQLKYAALKALLKIKGIQLETESIGKHAQIQGAVESAGGLLNRASAELRNTGGFDVVAMKTSFNTIITNLKNHIGAGAGAADKSPGAGGPKGAGGPGRGGKRQSQKKQQQKKQQQKQKKTQKQQKKLSKSKRAKKAKQSKKANKKH